MNEDKKKIAYRAKCLTENEELGSWNHDRKFAETSKSNHERHHKGHNVTIIDNSNKLKKEE